MAIRNRKIDRILRYTLVSFVAAIGFAASAAVGAASYPDHTIKMTVTYPPGGATDFQARIATEQAKKYLGQSIAIVNKPGAGGQIGWNEFVRSAEPDGYELSTYNVPSFIAQAIKFPSNQFGVDKMEPVANWGADPAVLIVPKDSDLKTIDDFVKFAKENPNRITVSGAGLYTGHQIATLQLQKAAGIKLNYIPTKGGVPALQYVIGKKVMAGFNNMSDAYRSRDRLRVLAIADTARSKKYFPDVPTFKESGLDVDASSVNLRGVMAPKGTPEKILDQLSDGFQKMFNDPETVKKMEAGGAPIRVMDRQQVSDLWHKRETLVKALIADQ
ncbi:tripartite tricarboxylate transporter substrate binding protein [Salinisphaera aquimarina]|uniref:Tripartite tricarboxylate transporter substrate binding protein n=1 Tax=Salinisphaera aquimarina TaxID=2094031 RepID=A0ABV7ERW6_9GAMM